MSLEGIACGSNTHPIDQPSNCTCDDTGLTTAGRTLAGHSSYEYHYDTQTYSMPRPNKTLGCK